MAFPSTPGKLPRSRALLGFCDAHALLRPSFAVGLSRRHPGVCSAASENQAGQGAGPGRGRQDGRRDRQRADHAGRLPLASRETAKVPPPSLALCPGRPAGISSPARSAAPGASQTFQARGHPDAHTRPGPRGETQGPGLRRLSSLGGSERKGPASRRCCRRLRRGARFSLRLGSRPPAAALPRKPSEAARWTWPHCPPVASSPNNTSGPLLGVWVTCPPSLCSLLHLKVGFAIHGSSYRSPKLPQCTLTQQQGICRLRWFSNFSVHRNPPLDSSFKPGLLGPPTKSENLHF